MEDPSSDNLGLRQSDLPRIFDEVGKSLEMKIESWREVKLDDSGSYATTLSETARGETNLDDRILGLKAYEIEGMYIFSSNPFVSVACLCQYLTFLHMHIKERI